MMKKLIGLALASTATLLLAGCGESGTPVQDGTTMSTGDSNKSGLGGYWFTWKDRSDTSTVTPYTGKTEYLSPTATDLQPGLAKDNGIVDDGTGTGNFAFHVTGSVGEEPDYSKLNDNYPDYLATWADTYFNTAYGSLCTGGLCGQIKYPTAGLGMGFKKNNAPLGDDAALKVGIAFKFRVGSTHPAISTEAGYVLVSLPLDLTGVPDPSFEDAFGTAYAAGTMASGAATPATNSPFCAFNKSLTATGTDVAGDGSCEGNYQAYIPAATTVWQSYCMRFGATTIASWVKDTRVAAAGLVRTGMTDTAGTSLAARINKLQFHAYQPKTGKGALGFDFWVDDVYLVDETEWAQYCTAAGAKEIVATSTPLG